MKLLSFILKKSSSKVIAVVDYGEGNIGSVVKAVEHLGYQAKVTQNEQEIIQASHVIVPGQGAFKQAMRQLRHLDLVDCIQERILSNKPFLGICLGFQILFDSSDEHGEEVGLSVFPGKVERFTDERLKIPHMGWNNLNKRDVPMMKGLEANPYVYFVHSYAVFSTDNKIIAATSNYGKDFVAAVQRGPIWGCQFHPEKSSDIGMQILGNFLEYS